VRAQPKHHAWDPHQGEHNNQKGHCHDPKGLGAKAPRSGRHDAQQPPPFQAPRDIFRYTTMELRSVITQYTPGNEMTELHPAPCSREANLSSGKEVSFDITVHDANSGKKRHKQHPQRVMTAAGYDGGNNKEAGGSGVGHIATAAHSGKHHAQPPIDHFERLLEVAYPNHAYPSSTSSRTAT
jgi:hypothetical protein